MNLIGIKNRDNKQWRLKIFKNLEKLGFKHIPHPSNIDGYIIISPNKEVYAINFNSFDAFMFKGHIMYEARNEKEFFILISQFYK